MSISTNLRGSPAQSLRDALHAAGGGEPFAA
jgi:hypothetical protein